MSDDIKVIHTRGSYRIIEVDDSASFVETLKGDMFKVSSLDSDNPEYNVEELKVLEEKFEKSIETYGLYGYQLQVWNSDIGKGWEHIDSGYGFIGNYEHEKHYIVNEFIEYINNTNQRC